MNIVLTDKSRSLALVLFALMEWGHQHVLHSAPHIATGGQRQRRRLSIGVYCQRHRGEPAALQIVKAQTNANSAATELSYASGETAASGYVA